MSLPLACRTALMIFAVLTFFSQSYSSAATVVFIEVVSGSRAPWGYQIHLEINHDGTFTVTKYYIEPGADPQTPPDISTGSISDADLQDIFNIADEENASGDDFFDLDNLYDSGEVDGVGISMFIRTSETPLRENNVELINWPHDKLKALADEINTHMPLGFELIYPE